ncbi:Hypothetical predicted protein [Octopus vulgaris]|uniref:Uncharacterized protein n=1 Tax=Octopus vulgaris TaxID=6645 RepID=A0AA36FMG6_OCTVU|nr:Hypothetical predicted protein [Octopus vulgaris]
MFQHICGSVSREREDICDGQTEVLSASRKNVHVAQQLILQACCLLVPQNMQQHIPHKYHVLNQSIPIKFLLDLLRSQREQQLLQCLTSSGSGIKLNL